MFYPLARDLHYCDGMYQGTLTIILEVIGAGLLAWLAEWFIDWIDENFSKLV